MNKREFETKKQRLWVYLRFEGKCAICGDDVRSEEASTDSAILTPLSIDELLRVRLMHPCCRAAEAEHRRLPTAA